MFCPKCGFKNADNSIFCNRCGTRFNVPSNDMQGYDTYTTVPKKPKFTKLGIAAIPIAAISLGYVGYGFVDHGSLGFAILFAVIGTIFSSIALYSVFKKNRRNRAIAIIGFVMSVVALIAAFSCYFAIPNPQTKESTPTNNTTNLFIQENNSSSTDEIPSDYTRALNKAQAYSDNLFMSYQAIYDKLTSKTDNFSTAAADYALENVKADYNYNAFKKAESYKSQGKTKDQIYTQLTDTDLFTPTEAQYAVDKIG